MDGVPCRLSFPRVKCADRWRHASLSWRTSHSAGSNTVSDSFLQALAALAGAVLHVCTLATCTAETEEPRQLVTVQLLLSGLVLYPPVARSNYDRALSDG
jgi:hypothetical protein